MNENIKLSDQTYVVFDLETTGLYPNSGDTIIEIGAVKICNGEIIDRFDELIDPEKELFNLFVPIIVKDNLHCSMNIIKIILPYLIKKIIIDKKEKNNLKNEILAEFIDVLEKNKQYLNKKRMNHGS
jgi:DNA polymerase III alpha subunit (gram-positive type)